MEKKIERNVSEFKNELTKLLNKYSMENESNTPDFILAQHLINSLYAFETAINKREGWYGRGKEAQEIKPKESQKSCPNCKETVEICKCMRNICRDCGLPVGNITFSVCDSCWENK